MCILCEAQAKRIIEDILPDWDLWIAKKDTHLPKFSQGTYGITWKHHYCPEPVFMFDLFPNQTIVFGPEREVVPKGAIEAMVSLRSSVEIGHAFIEDCKKAGWTEDDNEPASLWFIRKVYNAIS